MLALAIEVAQSTGDLLTRRFAAPRSPLRSKTSPTDLVTAADLEAERHIRAMLADRRPQDGVLGEEGGDSGGESGIRWVVDPIDGTVNFVFGIPHWAVSVACEDETGTLAGVVHSPMANETFAAARGEGATLGGIPIQGSTRSDMATALIATGFGYRSEMRARQAELAVRLLPRVRDIRRLGSAALDLAWTACGRYDGYFERGTQPWDVAAGGLICTEAGVELHDLPGRDGMPAGVCAAPPALAPALLELVTGEA